MKLFSQCCFCGQLIAAGDALAAEMYMRKMHEAGEFRTEIAGDARKLSRVYVYMPERKTAFCGRLCGKFDYVTIVVLFTTKQF